MVKRFDSTIGGSGNVKENRKNPKKVVVHVLVLMARGLRSVLPFIVSSSFFDDDETTFGRGESMHNETKCRDTYSRAKRK